MPSNLLIPFIAALVLALLLGGPLIGFLRRLKAGQSISEDAPERHRAKAGTPTMGGLLIVASAVVCGLVGRPAATSGTGGGGVTAPLVAVVLMTVGFTAIGFLDDYLIVRRGKNLGLKARQKLALQFLLAIGFVAWYHTSLRPPDAGVEGLEWARWASPVFQVLLIVGMSNAVNLTDGLDGLAAGVALPVWLSLAVLGTYAAGGDPSIAAFAAAMGGATLGYLWFNAHPAQVFMGDTGSLGLGGAMATTAILIGQEWILLLAAGVHVFEAASVTLQVISFKTTGCRIFKMSPLHHHFELVGWPETRVVARFAITSVLLCALALWLVLRTA